MESISIEKPNFLVCEDRFPLRWESVVQWIGTEVVPKRTEILRRQIDAYLEKLDTAVQYWHDHPKDRSALADGTVKGPAPDFGRRILADRDKDGLPDEWEQAHGLDPKDPNDVFGDLDRDGLSNFEEFTLSTDPQKADKREDHVRRDDGAIYTPIRQRPPREQLALRQDLEREALSRGNNGGK